MDAEPVDDKELGAVTVKGTLASDEEDIAEIVVETTLSELEEVVESADGITLVGIIKEDVVAIDEEIMDCDDCVVSVTTWVGKVVIRVGAELPIEGVAVACTALRARRFDSGI